MVFRVNSGSERNSLAESGGGLRSGAAYCSAIPWIHEPVVEPGPAADPDREVFGRVAAPWAWGMDSLRAADLIPEGFAASQPKVPFIPLARTS